MTGKPAQVSTPAASRALRRTAIAAALWSLAFAGTNFY